MAGCWTALVFKCWAVEVFPKRHSQGSTSPLKSSPQTGSRMWRPRSRTRKASRQTNGDWSLQEATGRGNTLQDCSSRRTPRSSCPSSLWWFLNIPVYLWSFCFVPDIFSLPWAKAVEIPDGSGVVVHKGLCTSSDHVFQEISFSMHFDLSKTLFIFFGDSDPPCHKWNTTLSIK